MAFALSFSGCPYVFGSGGVATLPTSSDAAWSSEWTLAPRTFAWEDSGLSWSERMKPLAGDVEIGALTFALRDPPATSGPAAGQSLFTYLATRAPSQLTSTQLTASFNSGDLTCAVVDTSSFAASGTIYVEGEAVTYTGKTATTFTGCTRARLGSLEANHAVDAGELLYPEVWADFPWMTRRLVVLWYVDDANVATALWCGVSQRAPRLKGGEGGLYELQCSDAWTVERNLTFVDPNAACRLRGFHARALDVEIGYNAAGVSYYAASTTEPTTVGGGATTLPVYSTLEGLCGYVKAKVERFVSTAAVITLNDLTLAPRGARLEYAVSATVGANDPLYIALGVGTAAGSPAVWAHSNETADPRSAVVRDDAPECLVVASTSQEMPIPVDRLINFPTSWAASTHLNPDASTGPFATTIQPALKGPFLGVDDAEMVFLPTAATTSDTSLSPAGGPSVTATLKIRATTGAARDRALNAYVNGYHEYYFADAVRLTLCAYVRTDHWAYGLQYLLSGTTAIQTGSDTRLWTWSNVDDVANAVDAGDAARELYLGGAETLGSVIPPLLALHGCGLAVRAGGRLGVVPIRRALANETAVATLAKSDIPARFKQTWETLADGIANVAALKGDNVTLTVRDANSVGRYGQTKSVELDASGLPPDRTLLQSYDTIAAGVLSRVLHLWADPVAVGKVPVNLSWHDTIFCGDTIAISEDLLPDGVGSRGLGNATALAALGAAAQFGFVIGRTVDLTAGVIWLELLLFPTSSGYAPCLRVAASPSATTITAATAFVRGAYDYTGGADAQGGAGRFLAGDVCRFVLRDTTTNTTYGPYTVQAVSGTTVTFTGALDAALRASIAGGVDVWDLRFDNYGNGSTLNDGQKRWAWIGGASSRVIATSTDRCKQWAP